MANEPAYQSGLRRLGRDCSSDSRVFAPREVIRLLAGGVQQHVSGVFVAGNESLAVIKRLRRDLAGVIYPHEGAGFAPLRFRQLGSGARGGRGPCRARGAKTERNALSAVEIKLSRLGSGGREGSAMTLL